MTSCKAILNSTPLRTTQPASGSDATPGNACTVRQQSTCPRLGPLAVPTPGWLVTVAGTIRGTGATLGCYIGGGEKVYLGQATELCPKASGYQCACTPKCPGSEPTWVPVANVKTDCSRLATYEFLPGLNARHYMCRVNVGGKKIYGDYWNGGCLANPSSARLCGPRVYGVYVFNEVEVMCERQRAVV